ncbi:hypothetical protein CEXT_323751 [Caerostris extrusa]|uniref:Histidine-rich glycoprotein-like n=1 Tax=Caerostris extrusa TaxID=172846 RepID=A0AAV4NE74_CAEEX|nr:hypothetical protein CEXT_323751 [Caerostris extrusa]
MKSATVILFAASSNAVLHYVPEIADLADAKYHHHGYHEHHDHHDHHEYHDHHENHDHHQHGRIIIMGITNNHNGYHHYIYDESTICILFCKRNPTHQPKKNCIS